MSPNLDLEDMQHCAVSVYVCRCVTNYLTVIFTHLYNHIYDFLYHVSLPVHTISVVLVATRTLIISYNWLLMCPLTLSHSSDSTEDFQLFSFCLKTKMQRLTASYWPCCVYTATYGLRTYHELNMH